MSTTVTMSLAEFLARPEEDLAEWSQGVMTLNPPSIPHQVAVKRLMRLLDDAAPATLTAVQEIGWLLSPAGPFRIPDVVVAPRDQLVGHWLVAPPILAVEVLSPDERPDVKLAEYAAAGLDHQWTLDLATGVLTAFERTGGTSTRSATAAPGHVLRVAEPFDVTVDPAALLR